MMHKFFKIIGVSIVLSSGTLFASAHAHDEGATTAVEVDGKAAFSQCSACHLASGDGVKGAFPPLRNRLANLSSTAEGRLYLQSVLLQGLNGKITVDEIDYNGYMQSYGNILNDEQISSVLNYAASELVDEVNSDFTAYTATEVAETRVLLKSDARSSNERRKDVVD